MDRFVEEVARKSNETIRCQGTATNRLLQTCFIWKGIYIHQCEYHGSVCLDVRRFKGQSHGLLPNVRGIFLSPIDIDIEMDPNKPRDDVKPLKQYTSLPFLTGGSNENASLLKDFGLGSANPLKNVSVRTI